MPSVQSAEPTWENPASAFDPVRYQWIEDEEMLRDEGVLDGMVGSDGAEKIAVIRAYHDRIAAKSSVGLSSVDRELEIFEVKKAHIEKLKSLHESAKSRLDDEIENVERLKNRTLFGRHGMRAYLGVVAAVLSVPVLQHFIFDAVKSPTVSWLVALVALLAGSFMLWGATSVLHRAPDAPPPGPREKLLGWLEEFGAPLVAVVFFVAMLWERIPLNQLVGVALLVSLVFFMTGRTFLGNFHQTVAFWGENKNLRRRVKQLEKERGLLAAKILEAEKAVESLEESIAKTREKHLREVRLHQIAVKEIQELAESRIRLYESERKRAQYFLKSHNQELYSPIVN